MELSKPLVWAYLPSLIPRLGVFRTVCGRRPLVKKDSLCGVFMAQIQPDFEHGLESLRKQIDASLEEMIASRIDSGEVVELSARVLLAGGKRLRPIMMCLSYEIAGGQDLSKIMPLAMAFEFLHTATLVHDDINDGATHRRGIPTIHETAGLSKAIIAGDWLFVQGYALGGQYNQDIVSNIANCCSSIAVSEFSQIDHIQNLKTSPEDYIGIVKGKTAGPFASGCRSAGIVAGATEEQLIALEEFGNEIGIAYQLVDDLLDLLGDDQIGKPRGADVYEGKMTLPLIHSLTLSHGKDRDRLAEIINNFNEELLDELIDLLEKSDSFNYTKILINNHFERAINNLDLFPDSNAKLLLRNVAEYATTRKL
ncbi:MAG TPA: polyprenyl synthetase family protein [Candidatus Poseidoniales archaeon]|nr:MAG TPA: polyprenyl synthetase family protein [Candidatus Poseidoniales archaeon]DAC57666.1 MAG TPA: polyprenyl synthetase family protein [Candidatus Poseidoniales archaeon]